MDDFGTLIANDFSNVVDHLETISLLLNRNCPETLTIQNANRSVMTRKIKSYTNVQFEDDDIPFEFQANEFNPIINKASDGICHKDLITDVNGIPYIVQWADLRVMQTVWLVVTRRKKP